MRMLDSEHNLGFNLPADVNPNEVVDIIPSTLNHGQTYADDV